MFGYRRRTKALITARITATIISTGEALELGILSLVMATVDTTVEGRTIGRVGTREGTEVITRKSIASVFGARLLRWSWSDIYFETIRGFVGSRFSKYHTPNFHSLRYKHSGHGRASC